MHSFRSICFFALVLWLCFPSQAAQDQTGPITSALQSHEFEKALKMLRTALAESPGDPQLWTLQGVAYAGQGRTKEALTSFRAALKLSPEYLPALEHAAEIEYEAGNLAAVPLLERVLRLRPGDPTSHAMIAVLQYKRGNCDAATPHFEKAGELLDSQLDALHAYSTCLVRLKQPDKAAEVFERAIALQDDPRQRQLLASLQLMAKRPQDAIATLRPLLESANPDPATLELASTAYEDAQNTPQAVSSLRQAILLDPKNVHLYLDFAYISSEHDSFQVGINVVSDGIGQVPDAAPLYFARGMLYVQLGENEKAEADFEKAYELDPNQSLSAAAQGLAALQANDLDRALKSVQAKLGRKPDDPILLYVQADVLTRRGADAGTPEFETAMRSAKRAVALRPRLAAARGVLAKLYLQSGQNQAAVEQCRKAIEIDPKDQTVLYRFIQALRRTGETREIPDLLKRLALLREQAGKEERLRYRYKLVEEEPQP